MYRDGLGEWTRHHHLLSLELPTLGFSRAGSPSVFCMFLPGRESENKLVRTEITWWTDGDQLETVVREILLYVNSSALGREHQTTCTPLPLSTFLPLSGLSPVSTSVCLLFINRQYPVDV